MRRRFLPVCFLIALAACLPPTRPPVTPPPPLPTWSLDVVVTADRQPVEGVTVRIIDGPSRDQTAVTGADGVAHFGQLPQAGQTVCPASPDVFEGGCQPATLTQPLTVAMPGALVLPPWISTPEAALRAWRGAIGTVLAPMPCGPRPGRDDNVLFTAQYESPCHDALARTLARERYRALGYTHWAMGPIVQQGYHGQYPDTDWRANPDEFLDAVEELWRSGFYPAIFLLPDTGVCADGRAIDRTCVTSQLEPVYRSPRFQALARIVVLAWEPAYRADDWQWGVQWMADVFPHALRYIHMESGHGAPGVHGDLAPEGPYPDEGSLWLPVAPFIHGYLLQDTWVFQGQVDAGRTPEQQFEYDLLDIVRRFTYGNGLRCSVALTEPASTLWQQVQGSSTKPYCSWDGDWPTSSATEGRRLDVVAFEYGSFSVNVDQGLGAAPDLVARARHWGRLAHDTPGVAGFGDGGQE